MDLVCDRRTSGCNALILRQKAWPLRPSWVKSSLFFDGTATCIHVVCFAGNLAILVVSKRTFTDLVGVVYLRIYVRCKRLEVPVRLVNTLAGWYSQDS